MYDVIVIGAGVSGCAVARELSRYQANVCVKTYAKELPRLIPQLFMQVLMPMKAL